MAAHRLKQTAIIRINAASSHRNSNCTSARRSARTIRWNHIRSTHRVARNGPTKQVIARTIVIIERPRTMANSIRTTAKDRQRQTIVAHRQHRRPPTATTFWTATITSMRTTTRQRNTIEWSPAPAIAVARSMRWTVIHAVRVVCMLRQPIHRQPLPQYHSHSQRPAIKWLKLRCKINFVRNGLCAHGITTNVNWVQCPPSSVGEWSNWIVSGKLLPIDIIRLASKIHAEKITLNVYWLQSNDIIIL